MTPMLRQSTATLVVDTRSRGLVDITSRVEEFVAQVGCATGVLTLFLRHTSASLLIQENADPAVGRDLLRWLGDLAPESRPWEHTEEGPDDMPAHAKAAITRSSEQIPVTEGRLALGTWQGIQLCEHRHREHRRSLIVHLMGV